MAYVLAVFGQRIGERVRVDLGISAHGVIGSAFRCIVFPVELSGPYLMHRFAGSVDAIPCDRHLVPALGINDGVIVRGICRDFRFPLVEFPCSHKGVVAGEAKAGRGG